MGLFYRIYTVIKRRVLSFVIPLILKKKLQSSNAEHTEEKRMCA